MELPAENQRIKTLIEIYCEGNELQFSNEINISQPRINRLFNIDKRSGNFPLPSFEIAQAIINKFVNVSGEWLLVGKEPMINSQIIKPGKVDDRTLQREKLKNRILSSEIEAMKVPTGGIPLVTVNAVAGFGNEKFSIAERDVKDYYVIPKFKHKKIDFMIEVEGPSMYPKYNSGDVVACTIIKESNFIQWNKTHVIATKEQGIIIKRIKRGKDDFHLCMVSDNENYDPFEVPIDEITGIALVAGVIRLE